MSRGGTSTDMISHYYDKLLHIARPPKEIVRNDYLEQKAEDSAKELVEVCMRYARTGDVDVDYILSLDSVAKTNPEIQYDVSPSSTMVELEHKLVEEHLAHLS